MCITPASERTTLRHRLRSAQGQLDAAIRMLDAGREPRAVLSQVVAVHGALGEVRRRVAQRHIGHCLLDPSDRSTERLVGDVLETMLLGLTGVSTPEMRRSEASRHGQ